MKKYIILFIIFVFILSSCSEKQETKVTKHYETVKVSTGTISQTDYFVGYTDSFNKVGLSPKVGGRIVSINKEVGDNVEVGELVASLDSTEAKTGYSSASQIIASLQSLKNSTSASYDKQIEVTNEKIKQLETGKDMSDISISGADKGLSDTKDITDSQINTVLSQISQAELGLKTAKLQLKNSEDSLIQKEKDIYTNSKNAITASFILGNNVFSFLDEIFGVTNENKDKDDDFEDYLGATNSSLKSELKPKIIKAINDLKVLEEDFKLTDSNEKTLEELKKVYSFFNSDLKVILSESYTVVDNSIFSVGSLSETQISTFKKYITDFQTNNENVILSVSGSFMIGLKGSIDNIDNLEKTKKSSIDMLEKQVENAEKQIEILNETLKTYQATSLGKITEVETGLEQAKKQKEIVLSQITEANIGIESIKKQKEASLSEIDAKIAEVKASMNDASVMIENGKVYSNISGIVVEKILDNGTVISPGMPILMISDNSSIKIVILVSENISNNSKLGDIVNVKIDGIDEMRKATITNIFPSKDTLTKRIGIELKMENVDKKIKLGSYAKIYFSLDNGENGIIIPNTAILEKFMIPGVYVLNGNKVLFKKIEILNQNEDFSEVNGLQIGENIITSGKENIFDGEEL